MSRWRACPGNQYLHYPEEIHEKLGNYRLFKKQPSPTDIRRTVTLLKKYQILEPLDLLEDLSSDSRMIIYPCINVVLMGDDARQLLASFDERQEDEETYREKRTFSRNLM